VKLLVLILLVYNSSLFGQQKEPIKNHNWYALAKINVADNARDFNSFRAPVFEYGFGAIVLKKIRAEVSGTFASAQKSISDPGPITTLSTGFRTLVDSQLKLSAGLSYQKKFGRMIAIVGPRWSRYTASRSNLEIIATKYEKTRSKATVSQFGAGAGVEYKIVERLSLGAEGNLVFYRTKFAVLSSTESQERVVNSGISSLFSLNMRVYL